MKDKITETTVLDSSVGADAGQPSEVYTAMYSPTLELVSRDHPDQKLYLEKNQQTLVWELDHVEAELWKEPPDPLLEKIAKLVTAASPEWIGSPTELACALGITKNANQFSRMLNVRSNRLWREYNISYENVAKHSGRKITLHFISAECTTIENI